MATYDIVFLLDNTSSMRPYVTAVNNNIIPFANSLDERNVSYRLGLVSFGDIDDGSTSGQVKSYGFSDLATFRNNVTAVLNTIDAGGDLPESGLEALVQGDQSALAMTNSSDAAHKRFVVVTDASFHDQADNGDYIIGNPSTFLNTSNVINTLNAAGVVVDVIGVMREDDTWDKCQDEWEPLANATGGNFYDINGNYSMLFEEIAADIIEEPDPSTPPIIPPDPIPIVDPVTPVTPKPDDNPVINPGFEGRIKLAQWSYGFAPPENSPLFGGPTPHGD